ncbi:MAG: VWA domain-containing protein [Acidobacteriota bacterium]
MRTGYRSAGLWMRMCLLVGFVMAGLLPQVVDAGSPKPKVKDLPEHWRVWIQDEVFPLISKEQKEAFLKLQTEAQRRVFSERLWVLWGRQTGYGVRFRQMYQQRLALARELFRNLNNDRARVLLIHGPPDMQLLSRCDEIFHPLDIWGWQYIEGLGEDVAVVFYKPDGIGYFKMWNTFDGKDALYTSRAWQELTLGGASLMSRPEYRCADGDQILGWINRAARWSKDPLFMQAMYHLPTNERAGPESSSQRFMDFSALTLDDDVVDMDFSLSEAERGLEGGKVRMGFDLKVPANLLSTTEVGDVEVIQVDVVGEISRDDQMVDRFRYLFSVPAAGDRLVLLIERFLRPGAYLVRLKIEDVHSAHAGILEQPFEADLEMAEAARDAAMERRQRLVQHLKVEEPEDEPVLTLVGPHGEAISGIQRFEAVTRRDVARVRFLVDGREILTKNKAPFDVDLDLGPLPRLTTITVVALDREGQEMARAENVLNVGRERFFLQLQPVSAEDVNGRKVKVNVTMNTPSDAPLEKLEVYWNDRLLTTLYQEPFEAWVEIGAVPGEMGYLRALATLHDGSEAEDLQFVNAPEFGSVVEVTSVELPVTVLDRGGKPVRDLSPEDFRVLEDGVVQDISHVSLHQNLPIRLGIVIDSSGSMQTTLPIVQRVVMGFLRKLLRPRDRAFIETFSDRPDILAPFTADFGTLENALLALYADRSTALYDATIMGLFQFSGIRGRKAMVVVTDGEDTASKYSFNALKDFVVRSGVTVYTIGIDLPSRKVLTRHHLKTLAKLSGGRSFFVAKKNELDRIYEEIDEELRTQYILAYTSNSTRPSDEMREIEVEIERKGVDVRTISGYYPGGF